MAETAIIQNDQTELVKKKKKFEFPDIYIILLFFIILVALLSWVIPAGQYDRETLPNGRQAVVAGTYQQVEQSPVGVMDRAKT